MTDRQMLYSFIGLIAAVMPLAIACFVAWDMGHPTASNILGSLASVSIVGACGMLVAFAASR